MKLINKILKLFGLTFVIRTRIEFTNDLTKRNSNSKKLLIYKYLNSSEEKIIAQTNLEGKWYLL